MPKTKVEDYGFFAVCDDTEKNSFAFVGDHTHEMTKNIIYYRFQAGETRNTNYDPSEIPDSSLPTQ